MSEWEHLHYEWWMLLRTEEKLRSKPALAEGSQAEKSDRAVDRNTWLEAFLVHARSLVDFLDWKKTKAHPDDLKSPTTTAPDQAVMTLVVEMHKRAMHLTRHRTTGSIVWQCPSIALALSEALSKVCAAQAGPMLDECRELHEQLRKAARISVSIRPLDGSTTTLPISAKVVVAARPK